MPPPSKKTPPPRFDPGILQGLQEPLTISVAQLRNNNRTPISLPAKDGTDMEGMPGSGWTRDGVARLNAWIEEKYGPGVYEVIVVDAANAHMEWQPLFMAPPVRPFAASAPRAAPVPAPPALPAGAPANTEAPPPSAALPILPPSSSFYPYPPSYQQPVNMSQIFPPATPVGLNQYGQPVYGYPLPTAPVAAPASAPKERTDRDRDLEAELRRAQAEAAQARQRAELQQQEATHAAAIREMELKLQQAQAQQAQIAQQQAQLAQVPRLEELERLERRFTERLEMLAARLQPSPPPPPRDDSEQRLQAMLAAERAANEQRLTQMEAAHKADRDRAEARAEAERMRQEAREREDRLRAEMAQIAQQQQQQMTAMLSQLRDQNQGSANAPMMDLVRAALTNQTAAQEQALRIAQATNANQITPMQILSMVREASAPGSMLTTGITQAYADVFGLLKGAVTQMAQLQGGEASPVPQMIGEGMHTISSIAERWMKGRETQVQAEAQARIAAAQAAAIHEEQETQRVAITHGAAAPSRPQTASTPPAPPAAPAPSATPVKAKRRKTPARTSSQELSGVPVAEPASDVAAARSDQMPTERELFGIAYESVLNLRRGVVLFLTHAPDLTSEVRDTAGAEVGLSPRAAVNGILEGVRQVGTIPKESRPPVFDLLSRDVASFIAALLPDGTESVKITQEFRDACVALLSERIRVARATEATEATLAPATRPASARVDEDDEDEDDEDDDEDDEDDEDEDDAVAPRAAVG